MTSSTPAIGSIAWRDLTVDDASRVRDFYKAVVGWTDSTAPLTDPTAPPDKAAYEDYGMHDASGEMIAGICHARGVNAGLPAQWLMYIVVQDVEASIAACTSNGGEVIAGPRGLMGGRVCIIRDPAGAVCALWQAKGAA